MEVKNKFENMVEKKIIVAPVDDVMLQSHQFTKQLGVVTSELKEFRKSNIKEIEKLKEDDVVEVIKEFWFYADYYEVGEIFKITEEMVNHNFEKFTRKK